MALCFSVLTFHCKEEDGISALDEVSAQGSSLGEVNRGPGTWATEVLCPVVFCYFHPNFTWIIPEEIFGP